MKNSKLNILVVSISLMVGAVACSSKTAPENRSFAVSDLKVGGAGTQGVQFTNSAIWPEAEKSACDTMFDLEGMRSHKRSRFAFLVEPFRYSVGEDDVVTALGSINLAKSPLMQFVLTTPAVQDQVRDILVMDDDAFLAKIKERLDVEACQKVAEADRTPECLDNLSSWEGAKGKYREGLLYQEKPNAVMRVLRERFGGLFGDVDEMKLGEEGSVFLSLLDRIGLFGKDIGIVEGAAPPKIDPRDAEFILTTELPLYPYDSSWQAWKADIDSALPAAVAGIQRINDAEERLCSLVLLQRTFAQLLMQKGYHGPKLNRDGTMPILKALELEALNATDPSNASAPDLFPMVNIYGAMLRKSTGRPMILEPADIQTYDPAAEGADLWQLNHVTPILRDRRTRAVASLSEQLDRLEALTAVFAATSPAAPWTKNVSYFLGDLVKHDHALIPFQTHTLALGLILMSIRNIGKLNIVPVDSFTDQAIDQGNGTGMVLLTNGKDHLEDSEMKLADLARLTRAVVRLDHALEQLYELRKIDAEALRARSEVKDAVSDEFEPFYSDEKLDDLETLRELLNRLKFPLAKRMVRMVENPTGCIAEQRADYRVDGNATREILRRCNEDDLADYRATMRILANATESILYWQKSIAP